MLGLIVKVFCIYNVLWIMVMFLKEFYKNFLLCGSVMDKIKLYNDCNCEVVVFCNYKCIIGVGYEN